jgi:type III pantothenate kinase
VVPEIITRWHNMLQTSVITTAVVPLQGAACCSALTQAKLILSRFQGLYSTMGCDRALAAYGAGEKYGYPTLVIDGGTALTLTGDDSYEV